MDTTQAPDISALLADPSIDHTGAPIAVEYSKLWITKASANTELLGRVSEDDVDVIHRVIAPAAMQWETRHGAIDNGRRRLQGAILVPVRLNLPEGKSIHSFVGNKVLSNNDFTALSRTGLPHEDWPNSLIRWRLYDSHWRPEISYPSYYIIWEDPDSRKLYALVPEPLEGMSRAGCDHCRIHDRDHAEEDVEYFDDRDHVDELRTMSAGDTAVTPFSLCRYHWWYVLSGELLRQSQVHALELLVSEGLLDRWRISHMRQFLLFMNSQISTPDALLDDDFAGRRHLARQALYSIPVRASRRCGRLLPKATPFLHNHENNGLASRRTNGDSQPMNESGTSASATNSVPAPEFPNTDTVGPAEPPRTNGQSMPVPTYASLAGAGVNGAPVFQAAGPIASSFMAANVLPLTSGTPTSRTDGFLSSPPTGPRAMRKSKATGKGR